MIKTIIRVTYSAFISIVLISIVLAGWSCLAFIATPTKSGEIINVIQDMYESQKSVVIDVVDLSKLLIMDKSEIKATEENNLLTESKLMTNEEYESVLDEPSDLEENGDNPLGIVIEPSLPEVGEENLPEISLGPLVNNQSEAPMNEMEIGMDMD